MYSFLENKLKELNISRYQEKNRSLANYNPYIFSNNLIFISGQLPMTKNGLAYEGKITNDLNIEEITNCIEVATSNLIWNVNDCISSIKNKISSVQCCNIKGYFNCIETFKDHSKLLDISSNMIVKILGKNGVHSRVAVGVSSLPFNSPVEIEGIFSIS